MFDLRITLFNYNIFTNQTGLPLEYSLPNDLINNSCETESITTEAVNYLDNATNLKSSSSSINSFSYTDCSNMSMSSYLNPILSIPHNLANFSSNNTTQPVKLIKSRTKSTKIKNFNSVVSIVRYIFYKPLEMGWNLVKQTFEILKQTWYFLLTFPETSSFYIGKRNLNNKDNENKIHSNNNHNNTSFIQHKCQKDPSNLRAETAYLRSEFKNRLKVTVLQTFESIYFTYFLGRLCVPKNVNIREREYFIYLITATMSTFIAHWLYYMPLSFLVSLNRNSEHLGKWHHQTNDSELNPKWVNYKCYYYNDQTSYNGKNYRVLSKYCSAKPGCITHQNFHWIFSKPFRIVCVLLFFKIWCFLAVIILSYMNRRWYTIVINIMEVLLNSHTFFILSRDFFILYYSQGLEKKKFN